MLTASALLRCLALLMDRLALACVPLHHMPPAPLPALLLRLGAAACVRRRLASFLADAGGPGGGLLAAAPSPDDQQLVLALARQHGECLLQVGAR